MDPQNTSNYLSQHGSNRRGFSGQNTSRWEDTATSRTAAFGGTGMMLSYSNQSSNSASSGHSAATNLSAPASIPFSTTMSSYDQQLPMFDYGQSYSPALSFASLPASMLNYGSLDQTTIACPQRYERERRETPSTLGWAPDYVPLSAYIFIVPKGEEPYWRLQPHHPVTDKTPERVYLDPPRNFPKGQYPCQYPGCSNPKKLFKRQADLERHYTVHAPKEQREHYKCDYPRCERAKDPFTRKDHYRDHMRDFHMEDLGQAKGAKKLDRQKWERAQEVWLAERRISPNWWRCAKCLSRVYVKEEGWECRKCNAACEAERKAARRRMRTDEATAPSSGPSMVPFQPGCWSCNGIGRIDDGHNGFPACPKCSALTEPSSYYYPETWNSGTYSSAGYPS